MANPWASLVNTIEQSRPWLTIITVIEAILLITLGTVLSDSFLGPAGKAGHPLNIFLIMVFVLTIVWMVQRYGRPQSAAVALPSFWAVAFLTFWILPVIVLVLEYYSKLLSEGYPRIFGQIIAIACPVLFLSITTFAAQWRWRSNDESLVSEEIRNWGGSITVLVMILALFAFGIRPSDTVGHEIVHWSEIPAILIVFILAELGVTLVALSKDVENKTNKAADKADAAKIGVEKANTIMDKTKDALEKTRTETQKNIEELKKWLETYNEIGDQVIKEKGIELPQKMGFERDDNFYWQKLFLFGRSWVPKNDLDDSGRQLLRELFIKFVGENEGNGTVRRNDDHIICITGDVVFAQASEAWLERLSANSGRKLVVWAVTTLLPTEFVFPSMYWGDGPWNRSRARALEDFAGEVIGKCRDDNDKVARYRRITVFYGKDKKLFDDLKCDPNTHTCRLDSWFVLDPRIVQEQYGRKEQDFMHLMSRMKLSIESVNTLKDMIKGGKTEASRVNEFPYYKKELENLIFHFAPYNRKPMYIFGSNPKVLSQNLQTYGYNTTLKKWLISSGWVCLRDWYCKHFHKGFGVEAAWWAILNDESQELIEPFLLNYPGISIPTFDLLMIGSMDGDCNPDELEDPIWHGAAISNLSFDRTECTIQLVTGIDPLKKIAESVKGFCKGFGLNDADPKKNGVENFGPWSKWPEPME